MAMMSGVDEYAVCTNLYEGTQYTWKFLSPYEKYCETASL